MNSDDIFYTSHLYAKVSTEMKEWWWRAGYFMQFSEGYIQMAFEKGWGPPGLRNWRKEHVSGLPQTN
jgi:hypothetical protein